MPTTIPPAPGSRIETPSEPIELQGSFRQRLRKAHADRLLVDLLALATLMTAVLNLVWWPAAAAVTMLVLLVSAAPRLPLKRRSLFPTGSFTVGRILLTAAVGLAQLSSSDWFGWLALAAIMFLIIAETTYRRVISGAVPFSSHLPGIDVRSDALFPSAVIFYINLLCLLVAWLLLALDLPFLCYIPIAVALLVMAFGAVDAILRIRERRYADAQVYRVLSEYEPTFMLYWDGAPGTSYQVTMWLPYLDRLSERYVIVVRNTSGFREVARATDRPVLLRKRLRDLDAVVVPSLTTVFYVNNSMWNNHMVRYLDVKHIQLLHGDSDKASSFNPVTRMYDKNFVAGPAAIDRFAAHGVNAPDEIFTIVGRPQVAESVQLASERPSSTPPRVLYAPTWAGHYKDTAYSSLDIGERIIDAILARGCEVIYRPHPYTDRSDDHAAISTRIKQRLADDARTSGRTHTWGEQAEKVMGVNDCFNAADAMISDVSSVVPDFLYSEKPFAICAMRSGPEEFEATNPIAAGGYVVTSDGSNIDSVLDDLLGDDPRIAERLRVKKYYLGDFAPDEYSDAFRRAALDVIRRDTPDADR